MVSRQFAMCTRFAALVAGLAFAVHGQDILVNRDFESVAAAGLGGVHVSGSNETIDIELADGVSSAELSEVLDI